MIFCYSSPTGLKQAYSGLQASKVPNSMNDWEIHKNGLLLNKKYGKLSKIDSRLTDADKQSRSQSKVICELVLSIFPQKFSILF